MVILFGGKAHVGKTTVAEIARDFLRTNAIARGWTKDAWGVERRAFADRVYGVATALTGVIDWKDKTQYCPPPFERFTKRQILELVGQKMKDIFGTDVWVQCTNIDYSVITIIDDLRLKEESDAFPKSMKVEVLGPRRVKTDDASYEYNLNKWESENLTATFNATITNAGDLDDLRAEVDELLRIMGAYEYNIWGEPYPINWKPI